MNGKIIIKFFIKFLSLFFNLKLFRKFRNDGRKYKGYWKNGKQHGEGEFYNPKENAWKKGVWSEGRRVKWENTNSAAFVS